MVIPIRTHARTHTSTPIHPPTQWVLRWFGSLLGCSSGRGWWESRSDRHPHIHPYTNTWCNTHKHRFLMSKLTSCWSNRRVTGVDHLWTHWRISHLITHQRGKSCSSPGASLVRMMMCRRNLQKLLLPGLVRMWQFIIQRHPSGFSLSKLTPSNSVVMVMERSQCKHPFPWKDFRWCLEIHSEISARQAVKPPP